MQDTFYTISTTKLHQLCLFQPEFFTSFIINVTSLITPLTGRTNSFVKNSRHFAEMMKLLEDESMVSFDVKSLFANVQVDEALEVVNKGVVEDGTLIDQTGLLPQN